MEQRAAPFGIVLQNVSRIYTVETQRVEALRGVDLTIKQGTVTALIGKSGAGKSTLLHIIGTLDRPTEGKVLLNGSDVSLMNDDQVSLFRNCTVGFVFQMNNLLGEFSALENVMLPGLISGSSRSIVRQRALDVLKSVGLEKRASHRPGELSGGEQQRVAIARALLMSPPILLADEPTGNLDKKTGESISELLLELCYQHKMIMILVTHDLELAKRLPNQIVMEDGRVVGKGTL